MAKLSILCIPNYPSVLGNITQDLVLCAACGTAMASQTMVSLLRLLTFPKEGPVFPAGGQPLAPRSSPSASLGLAIGLNPSLEHCDPVLILQRKDVIDRSMTALCLMMEAFSTQCVKHRITPATCDNPSILNY